MGHSPSCIIPRLASAPAEDHLGRALQLSGQGSPLARGSRAAGSPRLPPLLRAPGAHHGGGALVSGQEGIGRSNRWRKFVARFGCLPSSPRIGAELERKLCLARHGSCRILELPLPWLALLLWLLELSSFFPIRCLRSSRGVGASSPYQARRRSHGRAPLWFSPPSRPWNKVMPFRASGSQVAGVGGNWPDSVNAESFW